MNPGSGFGCFAAFTLGFAALRFQRSERGLLYFHHGLLVTL